MTIPSTPIAFVRSPFGEKFGVPRQPGLVPAARGRVEFVPPYDDPASVRGLEGYSHVWLIFLAHLVPEGEAFQPTVRPPRLGGNQRVGVFSTRSLFRPNRLGLSLVELVSVETGPGGLSLEVAGLDLVDGTPILDVKPYLPYAEAKPEARGGFAPAAPTPVPVKIAPEAEPGVAAAELRCPGFRDLLLQTLAADPRPAFHHEAGRAYGFPLAGFEVRFEAEGAGLVVRRVLAGETGACGPATDTNGQDGRERGV